MKKGRESHEAGEKDQSSPEKKRARVAAPKDILREKLNSDGVLSERVKGYLLVREVLKQLPKSGVALGQVSRGAVIEPILESDFNRKAVRNRVMPVPSPPFAGCRLEDNLTMCLARLADTASFWCGGKMTLSPRYLTAPVTAQQNLPCTWLKPDVPGIIKVCKPAPFGDMRTQTTVYDPSVRRAWEYALALSGGSRSEGFLMTILIHIQQAFNQKLNAMPYKLNVYGEGGFFKPHRDTPVDSKRSVATLVICLPSKFEGGEFIVQRKNSKIKVFDWAKHSGDENVIQWAAFFTDCVHEVKPVTKGNEFNWKGMKFLTFLFPITTGWRVTVTYTIALEQYGNLYGDGHSVVDEEWEKSSPDDYPLDDVLPHLRQAVKRLKGNRLGFLLSHKYTQPGLSKEMLKGVDQMIWDTLSSITGCICRLLPVVEYESSSPPDTKKVFAFTNDDLDWLAKLREDPPNHLFFWKKGLPKEDEMEEEDEEDYGDANPKPGPETNIPFYLMVHGELMDFTSTPQGPEITGNEGGPDRTDILYFNAGLVVRKPRQGRIPSLFRICKAVISWNPTLLANASLPEEIWSRLANVL